MAEYIALGAFLQVLFEKTTSLIPLLKSLWGADVYKELTKLQGTLSVVQAVLDDAEEKQLKDKAIGLWLSKLKDAAHDADDIIDEFHWEVLRQEADDSMKSKVSHLFSSENPVLFQIRMGRSIKKIVQRLNDIAEERSKFHLSTNTISSASCDRLHANRETHSYVIASEVVGRREDKEKIVEILLTSFENNDSISVLPIVGMGGLGKTTLAQLVYNDPRVQNHFQLLIWVCVSDEFVISRLAEKIIESATGKHHTGLSLESLQRSLRETLDSKRYLLVLDDVWNEDGTKWGELRVLLSHGAKGSAVLMTTRSGIVSSIMGTVDAYNLSHLSDEECWALFKQRAFMDAAEEPPCLVEIGKEIVKKFGGLPLAANAVGSFMRHKKGEMEWLSVLHNEIWDLPNGESDILPALRLSYNNLPSNLKECFAYCAIFPKDYNLSKDVLIQLWMANGLIPSGGRTKFEDKGNEMFNDLVSRSFLQNVKEVREFGGNHTTTQCKMHDLIHDLARAVTKNQCYVVGDKDLEGTKSTTVRHVSIGLESTTAIVDKAIFTSFKSMRTILKLHFFPHMENCRHPWLKAKSLRVLALPGIVLRKPLLKIDSLKHLRYLDLSMTQIETLPEVLTRLFLLQSLKLQDCRNLRELPMGMKNLKCLRHLYIGGCDKLTCMPRGLGNLTCLETLPLYVIGSKTCTGGLKELKELNIGGKLRLRELKNVKNVADAKEANLCSKSKLQTLDLIWSDQKLSEGEQRVENIDQEVMECLEPHSNIKRLVISGYRGIIFPNWMNRCSAYNLRNLVEIEICNCCRCEQLPMFGQLPLLESLCIDGMSGVKSIGGSQGTFYGIGIGGAVEIFPSLKSLSLKSMDNLEEWLGIEVTRALTFFPRLTDLSIHNCPKLTTMPHLPSVQWLHVSLCPLLLPEKGFFLKMKSLKKLYIQISEKLAVLLSEEEVRDSSTSFRQLECLSISYCPDLIYLSDEFLRCLCSLKDLSIWGCKNLVGSSSSSSSSPLSSRGLQLQYLTSLEALRIRDCEQLVGDIQELPPSIKSLEISDVPRLVCLPRSLTCLTGLVDLAIVGCSVVTTLPIWLEHLTLLRGLKIGGETLPCLPQSLGRLPRLRSLTIEDVAWPSLPEWLGGLTGLEILRISKCCKLISLPQGLRGLTQLNSLTIISCPELTSLPERLEFLTKLVDLTIFSCEKLASLPNVMPPRLQYLRIDDCPNLQKQFAAGGKYWHLTSYIPNVKISGR